MTPSLAALLRQIGEVLDRLGIRYAAGGSVASSYHGIARATNDVDLVAEIRPAQARALAEALGRDFYADEDMIRDALLAGRPFNVIHLKTTYKFDFFPASGDARGALQLERRVVVEADLAGGPVSLPVTSAEDTILAKLAWFKKGGCTSARQWNDVLGVVRIQEGRLDLAYLREWAPRLGVADWLERALVEGATPLAADPRRPETPWS
jgi:hypothetical protein